MVGLLALIAGCDGGPRAAQPVVASAGPAPAGLSTRCEQPGLPSTELTLTTASGATTRASEVGTGPHGVVLVPELGSAQQCGWWPYANHLAGQGMHVLLYDMRTNDRVAEAAAAVAALRARGATTVTLAGASLGGTVALTAAAHGIGVAAVAALSADELTSTVSTTAPTTVGAAAPALALPVFVAVADADPYIAVADEQALTRKMPGSVTFRPQPATAGHGWEMLGGPGKWTPLAAELATFLER